jgi:hypothetical protein
MGAEDRATRACCRAGLHARRRISGELFKYLSQWYYPAIRERVPTWTATAPDIARLARKEHP